MACFTLVILLSIFYSIPRPVELPNRRGSSSTINELLLSDTVEPSQATDG